MNYGAESKLSNDDKADLKQLCDLVWSGQLTNIDGTRIRLVRPFHTTGDTPQGAVAVAINQPAA